jgi:hypothetical protein
MNKGRFSIAIYFVEAAMGTKINAQTEDSDYVKAVYR